MQPVMVPIYSDEQVEIVAKLVPYHEYPNGSREAVLHNILIVPKEQQDNQEAA